GRGESCSCRRKESGSSGKKEVSRRLAGLWFCLQALPAYGEFVSHRGLGQSRRGISPDAAQCGISGGREFGGSMGSELELREEVQSPPGTLPERQAPSCSL